MEKEFGLESLIGMASPGVTIGVGLEPGGSREKELLKRADFCPIRLYRTPEEILGALKSGEISGAVRGSLPSDRFLSALRRHLGAARVRRLALLVSAGGKPFVFGPVGIDEGGTPRRMETLVRDCEVFSEILGWKPRVAVLSCGRREDATRGAWIRRSIETGERVSAKTGARHYYITVEEAIKWANCIVAPDGVIGNFMYRTLVHLGGGVSLGALYFPLAYPMADTSRSGSIEEYLGAIALSNIAARFIGE